MVMFWLQPGEPAPEGMSYIAASYIKFVEVSLHTLIEDTRALDRNDFIHPDCLCLQMAGGRAVPIEYDLAKEEVKKRCAASLHCTCTLHT